MRGCRQLTAIGFIFTLGVMGCGHKVSIIGTWRAAWAGAGSGTNTIEFHSDGTFRQEDESSNFKGDVSLLGSSKGTYQFAGNRLVLTTTARISQRMKQNGEVVSNPLNHEVLSQVYEHVELSDRKLKLGSPEPFPNDEPRAQIYRRVSVNAWQIPAIGS